MVGALALAGCGAGQITQTSSQASGVGGASANVGQIAIREAAFAFTGDGKTAAIYHAGSEAPLSMTVVNFGGQVDKLTKVSSPAAESVKITGDATIASGRVLLVEGLPAGEPAGAPGAGRSGARPTTRPRAGARASRPGASAQATPAPGASAQATPAPGAEATPGPTEQASSAPEAGAARDPARRPPRQVRRPRPPRRRARPRPAAASSRRAPPRRRSSSPGSSRT